MQIDKTTYSSVVLVGFWRKYTVGRENFLLLIMKCRVWLGHSWGLEFAWRWDYCRVISSGTEKETPKQSRYSVSLWWGWGVSCLFFLVGGEETPATISSSQLPLCTLRSTATCTFMYWSFSFSSSICLLFIAMFSRILLLSCVGGREKVWCGRGRGRARTDAHFNLVCVLPVVFRLRWHCKPRPTAERQT